ncbi:MAG: hypothetical protein OEW19_04845 [Acidobacteriota bacterium]|nr:hypothetical protein [Acidobacteriota bacterium]
MIPARRRSFNEAWTEERYRGMLASVSVTAGAVPGFPVSETPVFFTRSFIDGLAATGAELIRQLESPALVAVANEAVPDRFAGPNEDPVPRFVQVDFGLVRGPDGAVQPRLVELQAFPSLYGMQRVLADAYREAFALPASLDVYLGGLDSVSYEAVVGNAILGGHDPREVVLMEINPRQQKTWPDFAITEHVWGVRAVDTSAVRRIGRELFYDRDGRLVRIRRIYNRVIPDELERQGVELPFDYRDDLDVEWAGHPAWYFRISKFSIPWLRHASVPRTWFLHEVDRLPDDREHFVLKPLFSFAGGGIVFGPTDGDIAAIPEEDRRHYILQERIAFAPVIDTPHGPTQAEIRIMYVWTDELRPVMPLIRMGRGKMMGVDHNKGLQWVGASAAFIEDDA